MAQRWGRLLGSITRAAGVASVDPGRGLKFVQRLGTNGNSANYDLRVGMNTITSRPQQASLGALGPFFVTEGSTTMDGADVPIRFDAPAIIRKWPSLHNARRTDGSGPYLVIEGTLDECLKEFMAKPESTRHLYEIQTAPQPPLVTETLSAEHVAELARLREFL